MHYEISEKFVSQHAAKGGRQKGVGHSLSFVYHFLITFSRFQSLFGNLFPVFSYLLPNPFCLPPFAAR